MTTVVPRPSSLIGKIKLEKIDQHSLFKFTDDLQQRMEELLERKKAEELTPEEVSELESIGELDRIFTHINALLVAS
jgi:predicted transcriptional regulator